MNLKCVFRMNGESELGLCEEAEEKRVGSLVFLEEMCVQGSEEKTFLSNP